MTSKGGNWRLASEVSGPFTGILKREIEMNKTSFMVASMVGLFGAGIEQANAAIDVTAAIATFGDINTAVPLVGAAFLGALGLMAAWKLARGLFA